MSEPVAFTLRRGDLACTREDPPQLVRVRSLKGDAAWVRPIDPERPGRLYLGRYVKLTELLPLPHRARS